MVYIHSGGFFSGTAHPVASGPEYLMDTGKVIMVTIAYRLGPFGESSLTSLSLVLKKTLSRFPEHRR